MKINEIYKKKDFIITGELSPPKGTNISKFLEKGKKLSDLVDAVNVTDNQRSCVKLGSLTASYIVKQKLNIEPIYQLTCRDRNRIALQSDLLSGTVLGFNNVLCLTGDHPKFGDHPESKPVFDLDAVQLISTLKKLNSGFDLNGNKLNQPTDYCIGAVVNPGVQPIENQIIPFAKKIKAGAYFFQTQAVFDTKIFKEFFNEAKKYVKNNDYKIIAGIFLIKSKKMLNFMNSIPGVTIPKDIILKFESSNNELQTGIDVCVDIINDIKPVVDGIHIMALGSEDSIREILQNANLV